MELPWTLQILVLRPLLPRFPLEPKSPEKYIHRVPQSDPKVTQIPVGGPFKTHGIYGVGAALGYFGGGRTSTLFLGVFLVPTFLGFL